MKFLLSLVLLAANCPAFAQSTSEAILGYSGSFSGLVSTTAGWTFQPNANLSATSLGCFANIFANNPTASAIQVVLWGQSGVLLASNTITSSSILIDQTRYESITPVALASGLVYHLGVFYPGGSLGLDVVSPGSGGLVLASADVQLDGTALSPSGFSFPVQQGGTAGSIYAGPNFRYSGGVPEPSSFLLLGLGGLALASRWQKQRL